MNTIILRKGDIEITAENWAPVRKKPVLAIRRGNTATKYASFNSKEAAEEFMDILAAFVGAKEIK